MLASVFPATNVFLSIGPNIDCSITMPEVERCVRIVMNGDCHTVMMQTIEAKSTRLTSQSVVLSTAKLSSIGCSILPHNAAFAVSFVILPLSVVRLVPPNLHSNAGALSLLKVSSVSPVALR